MGKLFVIGILSSLLCYRMISSLNITVCDCKQAEVIGLMDVEQPFYCSKQNVSYPLLKNYRFFVKDEPHASWKGYACKAWIKQKHIEGFFFGGYDTTFSTSVEIVTDKECWRMVQAKDCAGHKMNGKDGTYSYVSSPIGEGSWMRTVTYTVKNCIVQTITFKKNCVSCPITSPYGNLNNITIPPYAVQNDVALVWDPPKIPLQDQCILRQVHTGSGIAFTLDSNTFKLIDNPAQLEFHYFGNPNVLCNMTLHKLKNIDGAYLQLSPKNWSYIYNVENNLCLSPTVIDPLPCQNVKPESFTFIDNWLATTSADSKCYTMTKFQIQTMACKYAPYKAKWNPETLEIRGSGGCLTMNGNLSTSMFNCTGNVNQKWVLGTPPHLTEIAEDDKLPLLPQHHQFVEDQATQRENIIENEVKEVYCNNLQVRRYTTSLLAETNGLAAAMANNLPLCNRLKPSGKNFIIQKCAARNITVSAKKTSCGFEPIYENKTIGRDGWSLHPFKSCFWKDGLVNLNGNTYRWTNGKWEEVQPTHHLSTLRLTSKFVELDDNENQYLIPHHGAHRTAEYEQLNTMNELATRIHETNADSLSPLLINSRSRVTFLGRQQVVSFLEIDTLHNDRTRDSSSLHLHGPHVAEN